MQIYFSVFYYSDLNFRKQKFERTIPRIRKCYAAFFRRSRAYDSGEFGQTCNSRCTDNGNRRAQLRLTSDGSCCTLHEALFCWFARLLALVPDFQNGNMTLLFIAQSYALLEDSLFAIENHVPNSLFSNARNTRCKNALRVSKLYKISKFA